MMRGERNTVVLTEDMKQVVREQRLGFAATVFPDGTPNLSPKGTTAVWDDEHLVFADISSPQAVQNLRANPAIEVNVVDPIAREGLPVQGASHRRDGGELFEQILAFYEAGDAPVTDAGTRVRAAVLVSVERALPLVSPAYDLGLTEDAIRAAWWSHHAAHQNRPPGEQTAPATAGRSAGPSPS